MAESYLDYTDVAVSSYIARTNKAINFYKMHMHNRFNGTCTSYFDNPKTDPMYRRGLFLCLGKGPLEGWDSETPPLPTLDTYDVQNPICFKYYSDMFFVKSDVNGKINVGDLTWTKVDVDNTLYNTYLKKFKNGEDIEDSDETKDGFEQVRNELCRWIYVSFKIGSDYSIDDYIRQVGIYSQLKLNNNVDIDRNTVYGTAQISTVTTGLRKYNGYLELIQNRVATKKDTSVLNFSFVLEF